jgi:hypothetical protein
MKTQIGFGFTTILFFIFLVLKLTNHIDWSWFWVLSPLFAGVALWFTFVGLFLVAWVFLSD